MVLHRTECYVCKQVDFVAETLQRAIDLRNEHVSLCHPKKEGTRKKSDRKKKPCEKER